MYITTKMERVKSVFLQSGAHLVACEQEAMEHKRA